MRDILEHKIIDLENYQVTVFSISLAILLIAGTPLLLNILKRIIHRTGDKESLESGRKHSIFLIVKYLIWVVVIILALQVLGVQITLLLAGSAALLVGVGLGVQQIFNDLVSGVFLLFEGSVQVGDVIEIEGMVCRVKQIKLRTSFVETRDGIIKIVPNHWFISETVTNWSRQPDNHARFRMVVGVSYKSDPKQVEQLLITILKGHSKIMTDSAHAPMVRFLEYADSSINFELVFWTRDTFRVENIKSDILYKAFEKFREEGIEIPFPQRDLHLRSSDLSSLSPLSN